MIRLLILSAVIVCALGASLRNETSSFFEGRIIGGYPVNIGNIPYQVSVRTYGSHSCGGSILNENTVVTAAHCTSDFLTMILDLLLNVFSVRVKSSYHASGGQVIRVAKIIQNPQYNSQTVDYDISLLKLEKALTFGDGVQPIPLLNSGDVVPDGDLITVSGWGRLSENGPIPSQLQAIKIPKMNDVVCQNALMVTDAPMTDRKLCAGTLSGGNNTCYGDSGGPAVWNGVLVGIVSYSINGCARTNYPTVYTKVANPEIMIWINNNL
ncbi:hypothetical protein DMENIID0001_077620 [Sergentomyia squamirostris]